MEKVRQLARNGMNVLLVCYNAKLASALQRQISGEAKNDPALADIEIDYFHALVKRYCRLSRISPSLDYSDDSYAKALLQAVKRVDKRYDAILADEGQDFKQDWWEALQALLRSDESVFYLFYDNRQNIYTEQPYYPITEKHHSLNHNCRTTRKVHDLMMYYYNNIQLDDTQQKLAPVCKGPEGRDFEHIVATSEDEQVKLDQLLNHLTRVEGIRIGSIVLLTPTKKQKSRFRDGPVANGQYSLSWGSNGESEGPNILSCSTIHSFKGLERDIVILAELDNLRQMPQPNKLLYVALSRSRFHIIVLGNYYLAPNFDPFLPDFPDE